MKTGMSKPITFILKWIARPVFSLALIGLLLLSINIDQVIVHLRSINAGVLSLASLIILIAIVIRAYRWRIIALAYGAKLSLWTSFQLVQMGNFVGQLLPASIGGDVVRAWGGFGSGLAWRASIHSILLDRIFGFGTLLIITILAVPGLFFLTTDIAMLVVLGSLVLASLLVMSGVFFLDKAATWLPLWKFRQEVAFFSSEARKFISNWHTCVLLVIVSAAIHLLSIVAIIVLASGLGIQVHLYELFLLLPPVIFLAMMPCSVAGWGVREGAMVFALGFIGVPREEAFALSVLMGILSIIVSLPGGAFMIKDVYWQINLQESITKNWKVK
jgi:uncharacterized protein (TIRG00374 family)